MDFLIEAAVEVVGEVITEGIDAAITSKQEKKEKSGGRSRCPSKA